MRLKIVFLLCLINAGTAIVASENLDNQKAYDERLKALNESVKKACAGDYPENNINALLTQQKHMNPCKVLLGEKAPCEQCKSAFMERADFLMDQRVKKEQLKAIESGKITPAELENIERECFNRAAFPQYGDRVKQWLCYINYPDKALTTDYPGHK